MSLPVSLCNLKYLTETESCGYFPSQELLSQARLEFQGWQVLDALVDGKWHSVAWLRDESQLPVSEVELIVDFFVEFGLAEFDADGKVRIAKDFKELL